MPLRELTGTAGKYAQGIIAFDAFGREVGTTKEGVVYASAARTATPAKVDIVNADCRYLHVIIDITAVGATPSVTFTVQGKDPASGAYYTLLASAALAAVGRTVLRVGPALSAAANLVANDVVPRTFAVEAAHGNAVTITYSVGYALIP